MKAVGENKRCSKCREWKHVGEFYRNKSKPDGFHQYCRPCAAEVSSSNRNANLERYKAREKRYRDENMDREKLNENSRRYRRENPERVKAYNAHYREKNAERLRETKRNSYHRHRDRILESRSLDEASRRVKYNWMKEKLLELGVQV